jgi:hypothetical protein
LCINEFPRLRGVAFSRSWDPGGALFYSTAATLAATATATSITVDGGGPAWWWHEYVQAELLRRAARREALARVADLYAVACMPWASGEVEAAEPATAELVAIMRLPRVEAQVFVPRLLTIVEHDGPVDDEALALLGAAMPLAA